MRTRNSISQAINGSKSPPKKAESPTKPIPDDLAKLREFLIQENHDLKLDIKKLLEGQSVLQSLVSGLVKENAKKDREIQRLTSRVDHLEQCTRRENVIIIGLQTDHRTYASAATAPNNEQLQYSKQRATEPRSAIDCLFGYCQRSDWKLWNISMSHAKNQGQIQTATYCDAVCQQKIEGAHYESGCAQPPSSQAERRVHQRASDGQKRCHIQRSADSSEKSSKNHRNMD